MAQYSVDFEAKYFGNVTLNADNPDDAEEAAKDYVRDIHEILPEDVTIVAVEELS